jgi:hypothetical protein
VVFVINQASKSATTSWWLKQSHSTKIEAIMIKQTAADQERAD